MLTRKSFVQLLGILTYSTISFRGDWIVSPILLNQLEDPLQLLYSLFYRCYWFASCSCSLSCYSISFFISRNPSVSRALGNVKTLVILCLLVDEYTNIP